MVRESYWQESHSLRSCGSIGHCTPSTTSISASSATSEAGLVTGDGVPLNAAPKPLLADGVTPLVWAGAAAWGSSVGTAGFVGSGGVVGAGGVAAEAPRANPAKPRSPLPLAEVVPFAFALLAVVVDCSALWRGFTCR